MDKLKLFFDSVTPFWIYINTEGGILDLSDFFGENLTLDDQSIFELFQFNRFYITNNKEIFEIFQNKIIEFLFQTKNLNFRGTLHILEDKAVIFAWPKLRDINEIKSFNLAKEMSHPNCILTDLLITKDLLQKSQLKANEIEMKKIEAELNFSRERTKTIIDNMVEGTIVFNSDFNILDWNSSILRIFQVKLNSRSDLSKVDKNLYIKDKNEKKYSFNELSLLCLKAPFNGMEYQLFYNDKLKKVININCSKAEIGSDIFFIMTILDKTEEVERERELDKQRELSQQNSKLASLGELAAGVGHEINNPLSIISGQISFIKTELINNNVYNLVEDRFIKINKSIKRITNITKGLRTFARADSVENTYFDISELIRETIDMVGEIFAKERVEFVLDIQPNVKTYANYGRMQQVIINLINNAKDALSKSLEKIISVSMSEIDDIIFINIKDSGCGIEANIQEKIFEPFFTTKDVNGGTGIGLALVDSIIKEHSGKISVESSIGQGTLFMIEIPKKVDLSVKVEKKLNEKIKPDEIKTLAKGHRVLIVDDEQDIREIISDMLNIVGVETILAADANEAIELFKQNSSLIKLVITDLTMPGKNGIELLKYLKSELDYKYRSYLTTGGLNIDIEHVDSLANGLLLKPFSSDDILNIVYDTFISINKK